MKNIFRILLITSSLVSLAAFAAVPHTFSAGTPARAADVNANFTNVDNRLTAIEAGAVSVPSAAFKSLSSCVLGYSGSFVYFTNGGTCALMAPVNLPHGATVTGLSCHIFDSESNPYVDAMWLVREDLSVENQAIIYGTNTDSASLGSQIMTGTDVSAPTVINNNTHAYLLAVIFNLSGLVTNTNLGLYNCKVNYQR